MTKLDLRTILKEKLAGESSKILSPDIDEMLRRAYYSALEDNPIAISAAQIVGIEEALVSAFSDEVFMWAHEQDAKDAEVK